MARTLLRAGALVAVLTTLAAAADDCGSSPPSLLNPDRNRLGAVASESNLCTNVGLDLLSAGGNAADALTGTLFCVGVVGMYHSGIAGGGFMLVRAPNGTYEFIDFRETAPAAATELMYAGNYNGSLFTGLASGVPGEVRGVHHLHSSYGVLPWAQVLAPAVKTARDGWTVNTDLVNYMASGIKASLDPSKPFLVEDPTWAFDFAPNGTLLKEGDTITRRRYADTLETIARYGPDAFYHGPIARATIAAIQAHNGTMTLDDLANYEIAIRDPVHIDYKGFRLTSTSAPSSGPVALSALKIFEGFRDARDPALINITTHRLDESIKFAYGQRTQLGDPSFDASLLAYQASMLSAAVTDEARAKIGDYSQNVSYYDPAGIESLETHGTSAIVAADALGLAISVTTTINTLFGSQVMVPETGVILNNEMNDFSTPGTSNSFGYAPSPANYIIPGKRPLSSISPVIVEQPDGSLYFAVAAAGGSRIITANIQNLWHVLDGNLSSAAALAQPRFHDQLVPNLITFEYSYNNETTAFLRDHGHNVSWIAPGQSTAAAVRRLPNGTFEAASEPRLFNAAGAVI